MNTWQPRQSGCVSIPFAYDQATLDAFQPRREFPSAPFVPRTRRGFPTGAS